jgi:hypothetical protein
MQFGGYKGFRSKHHRQCSFERNEECSRSVGCRGKKKYYILWVSVGGRSCPGCNAHAPYNIVICGLSDCTIFSQIISQMARFSWKKLLDIKCVCWFSLQLLHETFLILGRIQRVMIVYLQRCLCKLYVKYPLFLSDSNESWIFSTDFRKMLKIKFNKSPSIGSRVVSCGRTDTQTDGQTERQKGVTWRSW